MNKISNLSKKPFSTYSSEEKKQIKDLGRPKPDLNIRQEQRNRTRNFNPNLYEKNNWICGCEEVQALFCFPCVLFGGDVTWTKTGMKDLGHIHEKMKTHEKSKQHINNVFSYSLLGQPSILSHLNGDYRQTIAAHNEKVDKNRYILNIIINCIRFCGAFELALRCHDETKGIFQGLIDFSSELDRELKEHFNKATVFKGTSKEIQNDLLECMLHVYHEEVAKEIKKSNYIAVIADETTDVSNKLQLVIVLRYITTGGPVERFWNFVNPVGRNADSIADSILKEIDPLIIETPHKLISQSYDGASVTSGILDGVQTIIQNKYPDANYIHCYAHQVNLIMSAASTANKSVRIFFAHLSGICSFFSTSSQRTQMIEEIVQKRLPQLSQTRDFHSKGVNTVYEYRKELINVLEDIENNDDVTMTSTIEQAGAYKLRLNDRDFIFWLTIFHRIMPHVDVIFQQLQTPKTDPIKAKQDFEDFEEEIQKIPKQVDDIIEELELQFSHETSPSLKKRRIDDTFSDKKREALEVCESIIQQIRIRFSFNGHLVVTNLFNVEKFADYRKKFPEDLLVETVKCYSFLDKNRLKTELTVIYEREEFRAVSGAVSFLSLLFHEETCVVFQETLKLVQILVITPMSTSEAERCFTILKSIKTFLRNSMKEERLSALGMLSAEKQFLNNIDNFNKRVIDVFASKKDRRMDFNYRSY